MKKSTLLALFVALSALYRPADAQTEDAPLAYATLLARLCVNESGTRAYLYDDCAAMHETILFRAARIYRVGRIDALHRYSHRVTVERTEERGRLWIAELTEEGAEDDSAAPEHWPSNLRWDRGRRHWSRTLEAARMIVAGELSAQCSPHSWGHRSIRPADPTAREEWCGTTRNVFWSVPAYSERWPATPLDG